MKPSYVINIESQIRRDLVYFLPPRSVVLRKVRVLLNYMFPSMLSGQKGFLFVGFLTI